MDSITRTALGDSVIVEELSNWLLLCVGALCKGVDGGRRAGGAW